MPSEDVEIYATIPVRQAAGCDLPPGAVRDCRSVYLTKSGKTVACLCWLLELALAGKRNQNFWWVAPIYAQSHIAFRRMKAAIPASIYTANETELTITLLNGAVLWFKGAERPDALYGEDVYAAVIDEASRCREESWHAVRSTLTATRGPVRIIGNVKGRRNWAYALARRAEAGELGMRYARIVAADAVAAGILEADEVEDARSKLPDAVFRELYLAEASDDQGNPFGFDAIAACVGPLSTAPPVAWGVDLARAVDWSVAIGLDAQRRVCRLERFQMPWQETTDRIAAAIGGTPALVDSTGVGDPILERLQREIGASVEGFKFTAPSKQALMEGLAVAIQRREVTYPPGVIVAELEAFEYEYVRGGVRYSAPAGVHDDTVVALALAVQKAGRPIAVTVLAQGVARGWQPR